MYAQAYEYSKNKHVNIVYIKCTQLKEFCHIFNVFIYFYFILFTYHEFYNSFEYDDMH